jgi:hypothetical protein
LFLFAAQAAGGPSAFGQESDSFVMERITVASTADRAFSASYEMALTFAQEGPVGSVSVCNAGPRQTAGYWSLLGDTPTPVFLDVSRDPGDPSAVALSWSGSAGVFEVFRAAAPHTVATPPNSLTLTPSCGVSDAPPAGNRITYYVVVPAES